MPAKAAYLFEAASDMGVDDSGNGNDLEETTGSVLPASDSAQGSQSADFETAGSANCLSIADADLAADFPGKSGVTVVDGWTLTCWVYPTANGSSSFPKFLTPIGSGRIAFQASGCDARGRVEREDG